MTVPPLDQFTTGKTYDINSLPVYTPFSFSVNLPSQPGIHRRICIMVDLSNTTSSPDNKYAPHIVS